MHSRLEEFALALHLDKTRLLDFRRYAAANRQSRGLGRPETFTFLGFIFICGKSRRGAFQLQRKTRGDRMREKLKKVNSDWIEKCLAHEQRGVRAVYNKAEYAEQRRMMLQAWADMLDALLAKTPAANGADHLSPAGSDSTLIA